jgi:DNA-binding NtrC family response regulator
MLQNKQFEVVSKRINIVDDEPKVGELFTTVLERDGYDVESYVNPNAMLEDIDEGDVPQAILADLMMPNLNGIELLQEIRDRKLAIPVVIMTGHSSVPTAVEAMQHGAYHYLQKPVNLEEMRALLKRLFESYQPMPDPEPVNPDDNPYPIDGLLGESPAIQQVRETIMRMTDILSTTLLIRGETGTGKNLVARIIHHNSAHRDGRFMEINCAALPDNLLEAELFGYEKGAFTDAREAKPGLLEVAHEGTLFLDEIDSMSLALQAKLLSFLENHTFRRLGGVEDKQVDARILCATNADLEQKIREKEFRKDLFFRINVVSLTTPPLREMDDDIFIIARDVIEHFNREHGFAIEGLTDDAREKLFEHSWPGNVRELRNVIERAMIFAEDDRIDAADLKLLEVEQFTSGGQQLPANGQFHFESDRSLKELEREYIRFTLERNEDMNYSEIAEILGISKKTLWEKRKRYNLD